MHDLTIAALSDSERRLLDLIWRHGPISRKSLSLLSGLAGASASRLTKRILDLGVIEEGIDRSGLVGNPERPLQRSKDRVTTAGISFTEESISFAIGDGAGNILQIEECQIDALTIDSIVAFARQHLEGNALLRNRAVLLLGLGIAIPGYRARITGHWAVHWDFPELRSADLQSRLTESLGIPVMVERDAVAAAWAERLNGQGRQIGSFCMIYLAQGVGGALFSDGRLVSGGHGNAGGLGVLFPYDDPPRPSRYSLTDHLLKAGLCVGTLDPGSREHMAELDRWIDGVVPRLGRGFDVITRLYDPEMIVLSGQLPRFILDRMAVALDYRGPELGYTAELPAPRVRVSALSDNCVLQGALSLPIAHALGHLAD